MVTGSAPDTVRSRCAGGFLKNASHSGISGTANLAGIGLESDVAFDITQWCGALPLLATNSAMPPTATIAAIRCGRVGSHPLSDSTCDIKLEKALIPQPVTDVPGEFGYEGVEGCPSIVMSSATAHLPLGP